MLYCHHTLAFVALQQVGWFPSIRGFSVTTLTRAAFSTRVSVSSHVYELSLMQLAKTSRFYETPELGELVGGRFGCLLDHSWPFPSSFWERTPTERITNDIIIFTRRRRIKKITRSWKYLNGCKESVFPTFGVMTMMTMLLFHWPSIFPEESRLADTRGYLFPKIDGMKTRHPEKCHGFFEALQYPKPCPKVNICRNSATKKSDWN